MTCGARASCSALLSFLQGADVRKQRGLLCPWLRPPLVIAGPASDGPPVTLTFLLGSENYRILCWQEALSFLLSRVIVGNHFKFSMKQLFQSEGWRETCICCQLHLQYDLGHSKVEEWRQIERTEALLDIIFKNVSKTLITKNNWCLKHYSQKCHEGPIHHEEFMMDGTGEEGANMSDNLWGQSKSHHSIFMLDCCACLLGLFPSLMGCTTDFWIPSPRAYKTDVFSQKCAPYPNC